MTWKFNKIIINQDPRELIFGYRLTVGRQILVLNVGVRIPVPEPILWGTPNGSIIKIYCNLSGEALPNFLRNYEYIPKSIYRWSLCSSLPIGRHYCYYERFFDGGHFHHVYSWPNRCLCQRLPFATNTIYE